MTNQDKFYDLLGTIQRAAMEAGDMALGAACITGEKAGELLDALQLHIRAGRLETEIGEKLRAMGELLYATHTGSPTDSEVLHKKMQEVDKLRAELEALNLRLGRQSRSAAAEEKHQRELLCPICGESVREDDRFCRSCGQRLHEKCGEEPEGE